MDKNLQIVTDFIQQDPNMPAEQKESVLKSLKAVEKELQILSFKLDRTEKIKRTIAILLEETIEELEQKRKAVEEALTDLKATQKQLIQQEKLASLGQLTAGIAHEIKNPLNFVTNFSEVSLELVEEVRDEVKEKLSADSQQLTAILDDIEANLRKIHEHGSRADGIVKSMLQHSRGGSGKMEPTSLNPFIKEYVNLAFHGMRAGKGSHYVDIDLQLDESIGEVPLIAEDFSRVILNLCNNAFDAMWEKDLSPNPSPEGEGRRGEGKYSPKLTVRNQRKKWRRHHRNRRQRPGHPRRHQRQNPSAVFYNEERDTGYRTGVEYHQ
jgi:two-component system, NtrC family, sensor kinase